MSVCPIPKCERTPVAQKVKPWDANRGGNFFYHNSVSLHTAFHYHLEHHPGMTEILLKGI